MIRPVCLALIASAAAAHALIIQLDYTYDLADGGNFFGTHPAAKATLEQAAADLSAAITSSLGAINPATFNGSQGGSTASIDWDLRIRNPITDSIIDIENFTLAADTVRIYVGMRPIAGSTLGTGGPSGAAIGFAAGGPTGGRVSAFEMAEAASDATMSRGAGPTIGTFAGSFNTGGGTTAYDLNYGILAGSLVFDNDSDNSGGADSESILDDYWHFELTPTLPGQNDFYTVALHEMLHAIGIGTADTWDDLQSGTTWLGGEAIAQNGGSGTNLVSGSHIREGVMSFRLSDGVAQEAVMDPTVTVGTRKSLTQLDLAFLRDLGYSTIPEPSTGALLLFSAALAGGWRRRTCAVRR